MIAAVTLTLKLAASINYDHERRITSITSDSLRRDASYLVLGPVATRMWCLLPTIWAVFPGSIVAQSQGMFCRAKYGVSCGSERSEPC